jgi:transcriptional regulator NrdR family protein
MLTGARKLLKLENSEIYRHRGRTICGRSFTVADAAAVLLQVEVNNKREAELRKLRRDLEELQAQRDLQLATLRKKQQEIVGELQEQIDQLQKAKQK